MSYFVDLGFSPGYGYQAPTETATQPQLVIPSVVGPAVATISAGAARRPTGTTYKASTKTVATVPGASRYPSWLVPAAIAGGLVIVGVGWMLLRKGK